MTPLFSKKKKKASMKPKNIQFCGLAIAKIWTFLEKWHVCIKYSMVEVQIFLVDQKVLSFEKEECPEVDCGTAK